MKKIYFLFCLIALSIFCIGVTDVYAADSSNYGHDVYIEYVGNSGTFDFVDYEHNNNSFSFSVQSGTTAKFF